MNDDSLSDWDDDYDYWHDYKENYTQIFDLHNEQEDKEKELTQKTMAEALNRSAATALKRYRDALSENESTKSWDRDDFLNDLDDWIKTNYPNG